MIWINKKRVFEVQVRKGKNIVTYTVGAGCQGEAISKVVEKYGVKESNIVEVSR